MLAVFSGAAVAQTGMEPGNTGKSDWELEQEKRAWRRIETRSVQRWHDALWREYFCPREIPIRNAAEGIYALKRGGHPASGATPPRGY